MNLADCLKSLGSNISLRDQQEINREFLKRQRLVKDPKKAALSVVNARMRSLEKEHGDVLGMILKAGGSFTQQAGPTPITTKYTAKLEELKKTEGEKAYFNKDLQGLAKTQAQEVLDAYRKRHPKGVGVLFKEGTDRGVTISPSSKEPGMWQLTFFDERGFSGDQAHNSEAEAFGEAYSEGYRVPDPARAEKQMASDEFIEGNKRVEKMQKAWAEQSRKFSKELKARKKARKPRPAPRASDAKTFRQWISRTGGVNSKDPDWGDEIMGIVSVSNGRGGKKRAAGIPRGMLSRKARGIDERVSDAINAGWLPQNATEQDFIDAMKDNIEKPVNVESPGNLDKEAQDYYNSYLEQRYGTDWKNSEEFKRDEAKALADLEAKARKETLDKIRRDESLSKEEWENLLDNAEKWRVEEEQGNLFGPGAGKPLLTPTEPTPQERVQIGRQRGEIGRPKGTSKAVFPTGKITPGTHGKQQSLFDKLTGQEQTDLEDAIKNKAGKKPARLYPKPRTRMAETGERIYGSSLLVRNVDDSAALLAQIRKQAQERAIFLSADKDGNIINVHSYAKGLKAGAQINPLEAVGNVLGNKDVTDVYFHHNHPSSNLTPSREDLNIIKVISGYLDLKGVKLHGIILGARNKNYLTFDKDGNVDTHPIRPTIRRNPVKMKGRVLVGTQPGPALTSPAAARAYLQKTYPGKEGVLLLTRKHGASGFVEFPFGEKTRDAAGTILQAAEEQNAAAAVVVAMKDIAATARERRNFVRNISGALKDGGVQILDVIDTAGKSMLETYGQSTLNQFIEKPEKAFKGLASEATVYSTAESKPKSPISTGSLQLLTKKVIARWKNAPHIRIVAKQDNHPVLSEEQGLVKGAFLEYADGSKEVVLVAENIGSVKDAVSTILEETLGHTGLREGLRNIVGPSGENMFDATLDAAWKTYPEDVQAIADLPAYGIDTSNRAGQRRAADEWISKQIATDTLPKKMWDRIVMMIKAAARKLGFKTNLGLADVKAIARRAIIKGVPEGAKTPVNEFAVTKRFSLKDAVKKITDNPNFQKWFGQSKVTNEKGEPLVVYHGSGVKGIGVFDIGKAGSVQKSDWGPGIYFTPSPSQADYYRREAVVENDPEGDRLYAEYEKKAKEFGTAPMYESMDLKSGSPESKELGKYYTKWANHREKIRESAGGETYPVYLKMKNPYLYKYQGITDPFLSETAKSQGHDGIIVVYDYPKNDSDLVNQIDEIVAFDPTQIKSIYNTGTFDAKNPDIRYESVSLAPPFYSKLIKTVEKNLKAMPKKGESLMKFLQKQQVKPAEMKWMGVEQWLKENKGPDGKVDRQAFLDFLKGNDLEIREVVKGKAGYEGVRNNFIEMFKRHGMGTAEAKKLADDIEQGVPSELILKSDGEFFDPGVDPEQLYNARVHFDNGFDIAGNIYSSYQLPGGKNYQVMLFVMPGTSGYEVVPHPTKKGFAIKKPDGSYILSGPESAIPGVPLNWESRDFVKIGLQTYAKDQYHSPHWEEPNVLAHVRWNERTDADGKKVLFIEEIQSDWLQAAKQHGFGHDVREPRFALRRRTDKVPHPPSTTWPTRESAIFQLQRFVERMNKTHGKKLTPGDYAIDGYTVKKSRGVPKAPFLGTWHEYVMKRMLRYAAENGFDKVAWTKGSHQIDRYNEALRQNVDEIKWEKPQVDTADTSGWVLSQPEKLGGAWLIKDAKGNEITRIGMDPAIKDRATIIKMAIRHIQGAPSGPGLDAFDVSQKYVKITAFKDGGEMFNEAVPLKGTANIKGKTVTLKDVVGKSLAQQITASKEASGTFKGQDLSIGGMGMRSFYDELLPGFLKKYGKQWGAKVGETNISLSHKLASKTAKEIFGEKTINKTESVHSINITPEMRRSVLTVGQARFAKVPPEPERDRPWPKDFPAIGSHTTIRKMKEHPDYKAAKSGSVDSAIKVVDSLVKPERLQALAKRHPNAVVVPVVAVEMAGVNKIPLAYADAISGMTGLKSDVGIVQVNKSGHTGASALTRLLSPAIFEGEVKPGQEYIIVDDVATSGATVRDLRNYIEQNGGKVVEVSTMALSKFSSRLTPSEKTLAKIEERLGKQNVEDALKRHGITGSLESLAQGQLREIARYGSIDTLRNRLAQERSRAGTPEGFAPLSATQAGVAEPPTARYSKVSPESEEAGLKDALDEINARYREHPKEKDKGLRPFLKGVKEGGVAGFASKLKTEVQALFVPEMLAKKVNKNIDPLAAHLIQKETQLRERWWKVRENVRHWWDKVPERARLDFLFSMEDKTDTALKKIVRGNPQGYVTLQGLKRNYRKILDAIYAKEEQAGIPINYVNDYWPHIWEDRDQAGIFFRNFAESMGKDRFTKMRLVDKIKTGLEHGLKLKTTNPEEMITMRVNAAHRAITRMDFMHELLDRGLAKKMTKGNRHPGEDVVTAPNGKQYLMTPDRAEKFRGMSPGGKFAYLKNALAKYGKPFQKQLVKPYTPATNMTGLAAMDAPDGHRYAVPKELMPLITNAGLTTSEKGQSLWVKDSTAGKAYRVLMKGKNLFIPIKLGMSLFHPVHVLTIDTAARRSLIYEDILKKNLGWAEGVKQLAKASTGLGQIKAVKRGWDVVQAAGKAASKLTAYQKQALQYIAEGGGSARMSEEWRIGAKDAFKKALAEHSPTGIVGHGIRRILEGMQKPIFEVYVPSLKVMSYLDGCKRILERNPELADDLDGRRAEFRKLWKEVDNEYGELSYKTLFWNRMLKDIGIGSTLSMGWQLGFIREYGGGAVDTARFAKDLFKRNTKAQITRRMLFAADYTVQSMIIGGLVTWALTGASPKKLLDYFYPRSGETGPDGADLRFNTPFYTREFFALVEHVRKEGVLGGLSQEAKNKANPILAPFFRMYANKDYYGTDIRDPHAKWYTQMGQLGEYILGEAAPISVTSIKKSMETMSFSKALISSELGFTKAPAYITLTPIQKEIFDTYDSYESAGQTKAQAEKAGIKRDLRREILKTGSLKPEHLSDAVEKGVFGTIGKQVDSNVKQFMKTVTATSDVRAFKGLQTDSQIYLLNKMDKNSDKTEFNKYYRYAHKEAKLAVVNARKAKRQGGTR